MRSNEFASHGSGERKWLLCGTLATLDIKRTTPSEPLARCAWLDGF